MVLTYTFSSKDLANGFAFGRSCSAFGNAFICSFPLSTLPCQCPCELPPAPVPGAGQNLSLSPLLSPLLPQEA